MSLNFRDIVMGAISSVGENALVTKESIEREKVKPTYKCDASGIDIVITRMLGEKETRKLYLILSQSDENGRPLVYIKDGKKNIIPTENMVYSFLDGKYKDEYIVTGSTAIPKIRKDKVFINGLLTATTTPSIIEMFKKGLLNMEMLWSMGGYHGISMPWFIREGSGYTNIERIANGEYIKENVHMTLIKEAVKYIRENLGKESDDDVFRQLYSDPYSTDDEILETKHFNMNVMKMFVIIANRYDEPFALKCMKDYLSNGFLGNIPSDKLKNLLVMRREIDPVQWEKYTRNRYSNDVREPRYVCPPSELIYRRLTKEEEEQAIIFEKNRFWEYIKNAKDEGYGFELSEYIDLWHDYGIMSTVMNGRLKDKYPSYLHREHKLLINRKRLIQDEIKTKLMTENTKIPAKICESKVGDYEFKIMKNPADIYEEATTQRNCLADCYLESSVDGKTIIGSLRYRKKDEDRRRITIEIRPEDYKFVQIKAFGNASDFTKDEREAIDKAGEIVHNRFMKYQKGELKIEDEPKQEVLAV